MGVVCHETHKITRKNNISCFFVGGVAIILSCCIDSNTSAGMFHIQVFQRFNEKTRSEKKQKHHFLQYLHWRYCLSGRPVRTDLLDQFQGFGNLFDFLRIFRHSAVYCYVPVSQYTLFVCSIFDIKMDAQRKIVMADNRIHFVISRLF